MGLYQAAVFGNYVWTKAEFAVADDHLLCYVPDKYDALKNHLSIETNKSFIYRCISTNSNVVKKLSV